MRDIYLMLTEECPNRCQYCYIQNKDKKESMNMNMIHEIIKKYNPRRIIFFGGEPLIKLDLIENTLHDYYNKIKFQIVTSTSANYKEFINDIYHKYPIDELQLSWDGFNDNRIDIKKRSISQRTYENILYTIDKNIPFDIKCVISEDNVKELPNIHNTFLELQFKKAYGQFVIAHRTDTTEEFYELLRENLYKTFTLDRLYMDYMNRILAYYYNDKKFMSCDVGKYMVITPSGKESYCTALSQVDKDFNSNILQLPADNEKCRQCKYSYMCDGGCRYERYMIYKDNWKSNILESTCRIMEIYHDCITRFLNSTDKDVLFDKLMKYISWRNIFYGRGD